MIKRNIEAEVRKGLREFPVVVLLGPRQVGKTTLAKQILGKSRSKSASVYLDLELPSDLAKLQDPQSYLETVEDQLIVLDEVQRLPEIFPLLRALVDRKRRAGRFLLLGSASPHLLRETSESLAGRVFYLELQPLLLNEVQSRASVDRHWWRGGYPEALLKKSNDAARLWLDSLIQTYLERDLPQAGIRVSAADLRRFWTMLAHEQGQLLNAQKLGAGLGVTGPTIRHYLSILESAFLVRVLKPWHTNLKKRLVKAPKVFVRDSGILHALLGISSPEDLQSHPVLGSSWEGYAVQQIIGCLPKGCEAYFYRTQTGVEMDMLLVRSNKVVAAVEIKNSRSPTLPRGFFEALRDLRHPPAWVIHRGHESFTLTKGVKAIALGLFLKTILPRI